MTVLFDIAIVALLAFFAAQFVADQFAPPVANIIRPVIAQSFQKVAPHPVTTDQDGDGEEDEGPGYTLQELFASVEANGLFEGFSTFLREGVEQDAVEEEHWATPVDALANYLAGGIARALLFAIVFLAVQVAWFLASHALDMAFKLPLLSEVNLAGGLLFGLVKGALLTIILVWLGQMSGVIPAHPDTPVLSLFTVDKLWELLAGLPK